jgi:hypothetical protein
MLVQSFSRLNNNLLIKSNSYYIFKKHYITDKIFYNNSNESKKPLIIEYTPQNINIEYLVGCCEKECKKCKFSNKYDENAKECCGNDCNYCPDKITK